MEPKYFKLLVHGWSDETNDGRVVFNEGMFQEIETGYSHKVKFENYYAAQLDDKEAGDPEVVSELKSLGYKDVDNYGQLRHYSALK